MITKYLAIHYKLIFNSNYFLKLIKPYISIENQKLNLNFQSKQNQNLIFKINTKLMNFQNKIIIISTMLNKYDLLEIYTISNFH
jgi:hypothetical protein